MKNLLYPTLLLLVLLASCKKDKNADILYQNTLTTNDTNWLLDSVSGGSRYFSQGHYAITVDTPDLSYYSISPVTLINVPYSVQVDGIINLADTSKIGGVSVMFDYVDHNNHNRVSVYNNGTYEVITKINGVEYAAASYVMCAAIIPGTGNKNTIKVVQNQGDMVLFINNTGVGTFNIALPTGNNGAGVGTVSSVPPSYTPVTGWFNNFVVTKN